MICETNYAVEVNNANDTFLRQVAEFETFEEAETFQEKCNLPLRNGEYLNIIYIDYDENGDEVGYGSVV